MPELTAELVHVGNCAVPQCAVRSFVPEDRQPRELDEHDVGLRDVKWMVRVERSKTRSLRAWRLLGAQ
jgi:hypothetical protein